MRDVSVRMICPDLSCCPAPPVPPEFRVRWYRSGDERTWRAIHQVADPYNTCPPSRFRDEFGGDDVELARRQCYVCLDEGEAVATGTAWYDDAGPGSAQGRIHWVAVLPAYQGRGLGKVLMSVLCARLRELGCRNAYLISSTLRIPALNLYTRWGFLPGPRNVDEQNGWLALLDDVCGEVCPSEELLANIRSLKGK